MLAPTQKEQRTPIKTLVTGPAKRAVEMGQADEAKKKKRRILTKLLTDVDH
jgi:hypothetical protein